MSLSKKKIAGKLQKDISKLSKKDTNSLAFAIAELEPEEQKRLSSIISLLDRNSEAKEREEVEKKKGEEREKERFLVRLREKVRNINTERVLVKTDFSNCRGLLESAVDEHTLEEHLLQSLKRLESFIADVDVLQAIAMSKTAQIVKLLAEKYSRDEVEKMTDYSPAYITKLLRFNKLVSEYPLLLYTGYAFETLMHYKRQIEEEASRDDNFRCRLCVSPTITYQYEQSQVNKLADKLQEARVDTDEEMELLGEAVRTK